jgi:uncharacterized membrane protein
LDDRKPYDALPGRKAERARTALRYLMVGIYFVAGVLHLAIPADFVLIMPTWVPAPHAMVIFTGWCEMLGAAGLLVPSVRKLTGVMLAIYAICVFPANVHQAFDHIPIHGHVFGWGASGTRLALQPVLVWWSLFCGGVIDWPWNRATHARKMEQPSKLSQG